MHKIHGLRGRYTNAHTNLRLSRYYEKPTADRLYNPLPMKPKVEIGAIRKFSNKPWIPQPAIYITVPRIPLRNRIFTLVAVFLVCFVLGFILQSA